MAKQSCVSSLWHFFMKRAWLTLAFLTVIATLTLSACGGGYDGGQSFEEPAPEPEPPVVDIPAPEPEPTPGPIDRTATPKQMEYLDRGLVVVPAAKGNAVSWRLLGTDNPDITFDVYRNGSKLNEATLTHRTFYNDEEGQPGDSYQVRGLVDGSEVSLSASAEPWSTSYYSIALNKPMDRRIGDEEYGYVANDASAADLDGDGDYEIILKWMPLNPDPNGVNGSAKDNAQAGKTGNVLIDAYTLEGTLLWRIDLGHNIRAGAHYNPFMVYDFDGDGRAELAVKTADGTIDGRGVVIGDPDADYRNDAGYILEGPEFLTMFDGLSGEALDTIDYTPPRGVVGDWGDTYGNRVDRFLAGVAYLDGETPSLFMARGVYTRVVIAAYDWVDGAFSERWVFDTNNGGADAAMYGQGNHNLSVGDVDADGKDEIIYGAGAIDDDGSILFSTGLCDGDALHMGDFDPVRPGLEVFTAHETPSCYANATEGYDHGVEMHDAATGDIIWSLSGEGADVGRALSADIDPRYIGNESWASRGGLTAADGTNVGSVKPGPTNFAIWWDGDLLRELLDDTTVSKWNYVGAENYPMLNAGDDNAVSNNGTKATPTLSADLFGDWREEVMWANSASTELMIYATSLSTSTRIHSLMHDPQYRVAIAWQNSGYNQPPHPGFYIGPDMEQHWEANITTTEGTEWAKLVAQGNDETVDVRIYINAFAVSGIEIFRDTDADPEGRELIATLTGDERNFVDTTVVPDVVYYYWAELSGSTATTAINLDYSRTSLTSTLLPSYWVEALPSAGAVGPIKLTWETTNIDISVINIYRVEAASEDEVPNLAGRTLVGSPEPTATEWTDDSSIKDTAYFYWVEFVDATAGTTYTPNPRYGEHIPIPVVELSAEYVNNTIEINWALADFRPDIAGVELYRNTVNAQSGRTRILPSAPISGSFTDNHPPTSATDPGPALPGVTYWYTLKVTLEDGSTPAISLVPEEGITIPEDEALPIVGAWAIVSGTDPLEMQVSWVTHSVDVASIEIFRDTNVDGSTRVSMGAADIAGTTWVDTSPTPGNTYYYWVEVTDTEGLVHPSPVTNPVSLPPATNLNTTLTGGGISISWDLQNFPVEITSVELYRNTANQLGGRTRLSASVPTSGSFLDDGTVAPLVEGQTYWYMFKLNSGAINTNPEAQITYQAVVLPPTTNLDSTIDGTNIVVSWDLQNFDFEITSVELYRNNVNALGGRVRLSASVPTTGSFVDDGTVAPLVADTTYWYMFKINGGALNTNPEAEIFYTLAPSTGLKTDQQGGTIVVAWNLQNYPEAVTSIELYRNTSNTLTGRTRVATTAQTGNLTTGSFVDDGTAAPLVPGTDYWYMFKLNGGTTNTNPEAQITFQENVTNLTSILNGSAITLYWNLENFSEAITSIEIYRNTVNDLTGRVRVATTAETGNVITGSFTDDGSVAPLESGQTYWYMFRLNGGSLNTDPEAEIVFP